MAQSIKDKFGKVIGTIRESHNDELTISNSSGKILGRYRPSTNKTYNSSNNVVGTGNQLTTLL